MRGYARVLSVLFTAVLLSSCGTAGLGNEIKSVSGTAAMETPVSEEGWKTACREFLRERYRKDSDPDYLYYFLKNIDQTEEPELFVIDRAEEDEDNLKVYSLHDDVRETGRWQLTGSTRLMYSTDSSYPGIFTFSVGGGQEHYGYMTVRDGRLTVQKLWQNDYSGISREPEKDWQPIKELSSDKTMIRESERAYKNDQDIDFLKLTPNPMTDDYPAYDLDKFKTISLKDARRIRTDKKTRDRIHAGEDVPDIQKNNNRINGSFVVAREEGDFTDEAPLYRKDGYSYFYDDRENELKRTGGNGTETIINFHYSQWNPVFFAEDAIYYTDIAQSNKTFLCRIDYSGRKRQELYKIDTEIEQIYKYREDLWFIYCDLSEDMITGLGRIRLSDGSVAIYKDICQEGDSDAGSQLSFYNGFVYYNSEDGLSRLNIQEDCVEQLFHAKADAVNFFDDSLLFCRRRNLYRMGPEGVKRIKTLKRAVDGFDGIRVEEDRIYVRSYSGGQYMKINQIDIDGRIVKMIYEGPNKSE